MKTIRILIATTLISTIPILCFSAGSQEITDFGRIYAETILGSIQNTYPDINNLIQNSTIDNIDSKASTTIKDNTVLDVARSILYLVDERFKTDSQWRYTTLEKLYAAFQKTNNSLCKEHGLIVPICYLIAEVEAILCLEDGVNFAPFYYTVALLNSHLVPTTLQWIHDKKNPTMQSGQQFSNARNFELSYLMTLEKYCSLAKEYGESLTRIVCSRFLSKHSDFIPTFKNKDYLAMTLMLGIVNRNPIALWHASEHGSARAYFMRGFYTIQEDIFPYIDLLRELRFAEGDEQKELRALEKMSFFERNQDEIFEAKDAAKLAEEIEEAMKLKAQNCTLNETLRADRIQKNHIVASNKEAIYSIYSAYSALALRLGSACQLPSKDLVQSRNTNEEPTHLSLTEIREEVIDKSLPTFININTHKAISYFNKARRIANNDFKEAHAANPEQEDPSFKAQLNTYRLIRRAKQLKRSMGYEHGLYLILHAMDTDQQELINSVSDTFNQEPETRFEALNNLRTDQSFSSWEEIKNQYS